MDNLKTNLLYEEMMWDAGPMTYHIFFLLRGNLYTVQYTDLNCKVNELMNIYIYTHIHTHTHPTHISIKTVSIFMTQNIPLGPKSTPNT